MSQLTVDIVARVNDTLKKLGATEAQIRDINDALKQTQPAAKASTAAMNDLGAASAKAGAAARGSSQKFFQLGQAVSDFSVAGIRGAANNLEVLALQLGVGGPLLLGIAAATSALVVFGDDILRAMDPVGQKVKELRDGLEDVFRVIETGGVDLILFEDQIPRAMEEATASVKDLQAALNAIQNPVGGAGLGVAIGGVGRQSEIKALQKDLADAQVILDQIQDKRDEYAKRDAAAGAARTLTAIEENELLAETIRGELERIGLIEEVGRLKDGVLVQLVREGKLEEFVLKAQEKRAKANKDEVSELQKAKERLQEITAELDRRRSGELSALDAIRDQTAELNRQIAVVKKLNEARREQAERDALFGAPQRAAAAGTQTASTADILQSLNNARQRAQAEQAANTIGPEFLRGLPEGVEEDVAEQAAEQQRALQDEFAVTLDLADQLAASINYGLSDSLITLSDAFGSALASGEGFDGIGNTVLLTLADMAGNVGKIAIGTGIAIGGIKKALQTLNPIVAIGAGVALVALSAAVKSKLANASGGGSGGNFSGGSGGGGGTAFAGFDQQKLDAFGFERLPNGAVIPAGSLQPPPPVQSFQPLAPSGAQVVQVEGTFDLTGENLRASVRNTDKRVSSTRGVAA